MAEPFVVAEIAPRLMLYPEKHYLGLKLGYSILGGSQLH
jgi:hypothetical protein